MKAVASVQPHAWTGPDSENTPSPSKSIVTRMSELGTPSSKIWAFTVPEMGPAVLTCMNSTRLSAPAVAFAASPVTNQEAPDTEFESNDVAPSFKKNGEMRWSASSTSVGSEAPSKPEAEAGPSKPNVAYVSSAISG